MFSQFKNAVEQLAQHVPVPQIPGVDDHARRGSTEIQGSRSMPPMSSGQLAETALTSLRRSLSTQRSETPDTISRTNSRSTETPPAGRKSNLEERLRRATYAIGEASNPPTNPPSMKPSPSPSPAPSIVAQERPKSPASTPLPQSPVVHPLETTETVSTTADIPTIELSGANVPEAQNPSRPQPAIKSEKDEHATVTEDVAKLVPEPEDVLKEELKPQEVPEPIVEVVGDTASADSTEVSSTELKTSSEPEPLPPVDVSPTPEDEVSSKGPGVEELQQRLKQVEQRFSDVSTSFKRLQAEKLAADSVLRRFTPVETIQDSEGLGDYLKNVQSKINVFRSEMKRLNNKLEDYEGQLEDVHSVHVSETKSQSEQIEALRVQLKETEALFQASEKAATQVEDSIASHKSETDQLQVQIEKLRILAKEEEEKRVKAISLLKTVRQKLVKTEKERDEALQQAATSKGLDKEERNREWGERLQLQHDLETLQIESERAALAQRTQYDREVALLRERYEKELSAVKGQLELDIITLKNSHSKDIAGKNSQISILENSLNNVTRDKGTFFEQLQIKQAETESAQGHLESLQLQNTELEFQLRESNDRLGLLREEYIEYQREQEVQAREPVTSADDVAQLISATESRYEAKLSEMKRSLELLERERSESESNWSRKLKEKVREVEELSRSLGTIAKSRQEDIDIAEKLRSDLAQSKEEIRMLREQVGQVPILQDRIQELKRNAKDQDQELQLKANLIERQIDDYKNRESQLKQANRTLKEELRKVQSSAALLERQRNPGVGYWNRSAADGTENGQPSPSAEPSRVSSPSPSTSSATKSSEEEVNLEYLRNVILQFLEHKEMRPNLVKVISIILHFTPQETRRLMSKV